MGSAVSFSFAHGGVLMLKKAKALQKMKIEVAVDWICILQVQSCIFCGSLRCEQCLQDTGCLRTKGCKHLDGRLGCGSSKKIHIPIFRPNPFKATWPQMMHQKLVTCEGKKIKAWLQTDSTSSENNHPGPCGMASRPSKFDVWSVLQSEPRLCGHVTLSRLWLKYGRKLWRPLWLWSWQAIFVAVWHPVLHLDYWRLVASVSWLEWSIHVMVMQDLTTMTMTVKNLKHGEHNQGVPKHNWAEACVKHAGSCTVGPRNQWHLGAARIARRHHVHWKRRSHVEIFLGWHMSWKWQRLCVWLYFHFHNGWVPGDRGVAIQVLWNWTIAIFSDRSDKQSGADVAYFCEGFFWASSLLRPSLPWLLALLLPVTLHDNHHLRRP